MTIQYGVRARLNPLWLNALIRLRAKNAAPIMRKEADTLQAVGIFCGMIVVMFCVTVLGLYIGALDAEWCRKHRPPTINRVHQPKRYYIKPDRKTKNKLRKLK